ncbi:DUF4185 domain-containing protein [Acidobacteria bacterium AH-259-L09]|nr:DUF4185 domain-containing protein [Acidobacteria bacterium AH-259-L09]
MTPSTSRMIRVISVALSLLLCLVSNGAASHPSDYFKITVVDEETGRGVPLVELKTTSGVRYYTDSNGIVAFYEPGLMDQLVYFHIKSHGYEFPQDGFGYRGRALKVTAGGSAVLKIKRINVAERLYRITGQGIYRDSIIVGHSVPTERPVLNAQVAGQDAGRAIPYRGKPYWFWGDTNKMSYPLGNFGVSGATSEWPNKGGLDPSVGVNLTYFVNKSGFSKKMCPIPGVWFGPLMTVKDSKGTERLIAAYRPRKKDKKPYRQGLIIFDDKTEAFEPLVQFGLKAPLHLDGCSLRLDVGGKDYYYFTSGYGFIRVKADLEQITDLSAYEAFTCLVTGNRYDKASPNLERGPDGRLIWAWKANTEPIGYDRERELIAAEKMRPEEALFQLLDIDSGALTWTRPGSVYWNDFRRRWVMIGQEGMSGVCYAEADTPVGPWVYAKKIVTHNDYTFYLPTQHPFFDQHGGRLIYFEGTYTNIFSGNPDQTPRYDYNQIMYRLKLDDPRLFLPMPVYRIRSGDGMPRYLMREGVESEKAWERIEEVAFFAMPPDRRREGLIPIFATIEEGRILLQLEPPTTTGDPGEPLFYGLPTEFQPLEEKLASTWRCEAKDSEGSEIPFILELKLEGEEVKGSSPDGMLEITKGRFKEGKLDLNLKDKEDRSTYFLTAALEEGRLIGEWKDNDTGETGTWEGHRTDFAWQQLSSPAVVPLYEYGRKDGSGHFYSTDPDLKNEALQRSAEPICRVWRNPISLLVLDHKTKPLALEKGRK